jgi:hypothetical protein
MTDDETERFALALERLMLKMSADTSAESEYADLCDALGVDEADFRVWLQSHVPQLESELKKRQH